MTTPDYATVLTALHARFATIPALVRLDANGVNQAILDYEPPSIQDFPTLYSLLDRVEFNPATPVKASRYVTLHRLCFQWQDVMMAERQLRPYIDSLPSTVNATDAGRRLGLGAGMSRGIATITGVQAVFVMIGGTLCRCLDFTSEVTTK